MLRLLVAALAVVSLLVACGGSPTSSSTPVASTPLTGTIDGKAWSAVTALASAEKAFSDGGAERWLDVYDTQVGCHDFATEAQLIGVVPWVADAGYELSFSHNLTFVVRQADGGILNDVAVDGRVELLTAPTTGQATLRLRATAGSTNSVEGQVAVTVCD
jgi:hypothetical protein